MSVFQDRKEEAEKKRIEALNRKKEAQKLLEEEEVSLKGREKAPASAKKVTRGQIQTTLTSVNKEREAESEARAKARAKVTTEEEYVAELGENVNRLHIDEEGASNVDDAIAVLT